MARIVCSAVDVGIECQYTAVMTTPVALCEEHRIQVALIAVPDILASALRSAQRGESAVAAPEAETEALCDGALPVEIGVHLGGTHLPVVYFIANGNRVKIGTSVNTSKRIATLALQRSDVLLLLRGGPMLERALHRRFGAHRIGSTEWFSLAEEVRAYVAAKRASLTELRDAAAELADLESSLAPVPLRSVTHVEAQPAVHDRGNEDAPTYPDGSEIAANYRALWVAVERLPAGFTYRDVAATGVMKGRGSVQGPLDMWRNLGYIVAVGARRGQAGPPSTTWRLVDPSEIGRDQEQEIA